MSTRFSGDSADAVIFGRHAVREALEAGRPLGRLYVQETLADRMPVSALCRTAEARGIPVRRISRQGLDRLTGGGVHQGVAASLAAAVWTPEAALENVVRTKPDPIVLVLDGVVDPHNLGAVVRVADAGGAAAVLVPRHGSAPPSAAAMKASAGALAWVPLIAVTNVARTLETLKSWGLFVWAAVPDGAQPYTSVDWRGGVVLVVGGEGRGVRPLVVRHADGTVRLPMHGRVASLNVAVATGILVYEILRQRA
jgi:23S rRNA (guanosine2251-2'-O)-methyltransferase